MQRLEKSWQRYRFVCTTKDALIIIVGRVADAEVREKLAKI